MAKLKNNKKKQDKEEGFAFENYSYCDEVETGVVLRKTRTPSGSDCE